MKAILRLVSQKLPLPEPHAQPDAQKNPGNPAHYPSEFTVQQFTNRSVFRSVFSIPSTYISFCVD